MTQPRSVRLSQTLVPFGVGAIYDLMGESLIACDIGYWKGRGEPVRLERLEKELGVDGFRSAPSHTSLFAGSSKGIPYVRFPQWLFCQRCRTMVRWRWAMEVEGQPPQCQRCPRGPQLVPMRFVVACRDGHLGDVAWDRWAHSNAKSPNQKQCRSQNLRFITERESGAGLESLRVECATCEAKRSLKGITGSGSMRPLGVKCPGRQPWQRIEQAVSCTQDPQVLQRGAGNLYFARIRSAIDIPPQSNYATYNDITLKVTNTLEYQVLRSSPNGPLATGLADAIATKVGCTADQVRTIVARELAAEAGTGESETLGEEQDLETAEWHAFLTPQAEQDDRDRFITKSVAFVDEAETPALEELARLVDRIVLASRLREVRALHGFTRYDPDGELVRPDLGRGLDWLPAVEVYGEGVFLSLAEDEVARWEREDEAISIAAGLEDRRRGSLFGDRLPQATPRFILLHTLAHLLIRQLTFQCGYAASSLRERIYSRTPSEGAPQAGILIYTAAGDVEGTLGGLVRQGEPPRLAQTLLSALERADWCSSDPICRESTGQGFGSLNRGACHACALISETSCVYANTVLDRAFVVGTGIVKGYFERVLDVARAAGAVTREVR
jgi:hypothetical protein